MSSASRPGVSDFGISGGDGAVHRGDDPRFDLAAAVRRVVAAIVAGDIDDEHLRAATAAVASVADALEAAAGPHRRPRVQPDPAGAAQDFFPTSPVIGFANPLAPPVRVEVVDGELQGTAWFDYQYEGPPTCVHGGVIALVMDELLGSANIVAGNPAMTGTLTIRYRRPTPLRTELRLRARCLGRSGRKVRAWGGMYLGDELTAEAEGIFVELGPERFVAMIAEAGLASAGDASAGPAGGAAAG